MDTIGHLFISVRKGAVVNVRERERERERERRERERGEREREREREKHTRRSQTKGHIYVNQFSSPFLQTCTGDKKNKPRTTIIYTTEREDKIIDSESCVNGMLVWTWVTDYSVCLCECVLCACLNNNKIRKNWSNVPPKLLTCIRFLCKVVHKIGRLRKFNRAREIEFKVARNEVKNSSIAQRSAHRDSRIWRPELIEPAAERKRRARMLDNDGRSNRPTPTHRFCHSAIFHPITPYNVWFFWVSRQRSIILAKKWKHFRADFEKFQEMCENLNYRKR